MITKKIILASALSVMASVGFSQKVYLSLNTGFASSAVSDDIGSKSTTTASGTTTENIYGTLGAGVPVTLSAGYMVTKHIGVELGVNYFLGSEVTVRENTNDVVGSKLTATAKTSQLRLLPSLMITTGGEGLNMYAKAGLVLPVTGKAISKI